MREVDTALKALLSNNNIPDECIDHIRVETLSSRDRFSLATMFCKRLPACLLALFRRRLEPALLA